MSPYPLFVLAKEAQQTVEPRKERGRGGGTEGGEKDRKTERALRKITA